MTENEVLDEFRAAGALLQGHFILTSGLRSPVFLRQLGAKAIFVEREGGKFALRRGFEIEPGAKVITVEDIVTTGLSVRETLDSLKEHLTGGAEVVAAACLIDRSGGKADVGVPVVALATMDIPNYSPDALPPELAAQPPVKPGSRGLKV
jgi:orotate phosphoribosyltransferase